MAIKLSVLDTAPVSLNVLGESGVNLNVQDEFIGNMPMYTDSYEFTPSINEQTISIAGKRATSDIIIHPIPQSYGLITWNGSTLTVS